MAIYPGCLRWYGTGRWLLLLAVGMLMAAPAAAQPTLHDRVQPLIDQYAGTVAISVKHLPSGEGFEHRGDEPLPTASLIKFPVLIEAYQQAAEGRLDLQRRIALREEDKVPGSGVLTPHFSPGTELTVRDAIRLMIAFSDNTATNLVIDQIGLPATNQRMAALGCPNTQLNAKVFRRDTSLAPARSQKFGLGSTTANEMVSLFERLAAGALVNGEACQQMLEHLYACEDRTKLVRFLPPDVKVAHKTGAVAQSRCDAGLIDAPSGRIAICVLTTDNEDRSWSDENQAHLFCGQVAKAVYEHFNPPAAGVANTLPAPAMGVQGELFEADANVPLPDVVNAAELPRDPADPLDGPPLVSCRAWGILDAASGQMLWSDNDDQPLDPASTTKIMTAFVTLQLAQADPTILDQDVVFSERADQTEGSTSQLKPGEIVKLDELLYGLLLPSGNDASVAIAEFVGARLPAAPDAPLAAADPLVRFVDLMNRTAAELGLQDTSYQNPHGLTADGHLTSVRDLARLAQHAMALPRFREVVGARQRGCLVRSQQGYTRHVLWKNTNQLLAIDGFAGIKTGTTHAAGACLVSFGSRDGRDLIVVTLGSTSSDGRYVDARNLFRWAWRQLADGAEPASAAAVARPSGPAVEVTAAARELHASALLVDGHNDLPWRFRDLGTPSFDQVDLKQPQPQMHTDIPRLLQGGVGAQFWSVYVPVETSRDGRALLTTLEQIDFVDAMVKRYPETFRLALTHDDILACRRDGKIACLIGVEGGHCIENSLNVLRQLYDRGARYMTLTHSETLAWADSATDDSRNGGLNAFGEEVVREMNRLGMLVDLSHVSVETMRDALRVSRAPVIYSHSSARGIADHPRNVPDDILKLVAENGGVVMVNFYSGFVVPSSAQRGVDWLAYRRKVKAEGHSNGKLAELMATWEAQHPAARGSIYDVVDHIDHLVQQAGVDGVGLGSDFDGIDMVPEQLEDVSTYPRITQVLLDRGYTSEQIRKILGGNVLRVLKAAEVVAGR